MPRKRILSLILCMLLLVQLIPFNVSAASTDIPGSLVIETSDTDKKQPATGYTDKDGYYADIYFSTVSSVPTGWSGVEYNAYVQEISRTGVAGTYKKYENIEYSGSPLASTRIKGLKSGTIYNIYVTANYYTYNNATQLVKSSEGEKSNVVTVMTDIKLTASPYGAKQIKIEWDDAWLAGNRISYELYIADESKFDGVKPITISSTQIGVDGKVNINQTTGKLSYIHTVSDSGKVYFVKIKPNFNSVPVFSNSESKIVATSSFILVKTTKLYDTDEGAMWRLDWSQVAVSFDILNISYQIYKGNTNSNNLEEFLFSVTNNSAPILETSNAEGNYYIIKALVLDSEGENYYKDWPEVSIQSDKIYLKESEIPATPAAPELTDKIVSNGKVIASYSDSLQPDSAKVLWELPRTGTGEIDYDVVYDIWLITDPQKLDIPDTSSLVASDVKLSDILVKDDGKPIGASYNLTSLVPNTTYYFRIVAKKTYIGYSDGDVKNITLTSEASSKLVITPPKENGNTPVALNSPPLKVKEDLDYKKVVGETTATITTLNKWYEVFNYQTMKWEYRKLRWNSTTNQYEAITDATVTDDTYGKDYRIVEYDGGVTLSVGVIKKTDLPSNFAASDLNDITKYPTSFLEDISVNPNDSNENAGSNPDKKKHNVDINLTGLEANTTYVVWVRAVRNSTGAVSDSSDPIYLTTNPDSTYIPETPPVPNFNYGFAGDTYVLLSWDYDTKYTYNIMYSTGEDVTKAEGKITITGYEMVTLRTLKITDLKKSTNYYFWIQAENVYNEQKIDSDFSDAYHLMTTEYTPPATPYGFGIKGTSSSVTKESITYEWMVISGLNYSLEIADNINYTNSTVYDAGTASEYTVTGLKPNTRYYARLYAIDTETSLKSEPTQSIIAKTLKSKDDYDTDEDTETVISGEFIVKDSYASSGTWGVAIVGVNADRFIESVKTSKVLDYTMDLKNPPDEIITINVTISGKVFTELSRLGRTITFATKDYSISFGPGALDFDTNDRNVYTNYVVALSSGVNDSTVKPSNIDVKTKIGRVQIKSQQGTGYSIISTFGKPALISYNLSDPTWYNAADSFGYVLKNNSWLNVESQYKQDSLRGKDYLKFNAEEPSDFLVGQQSSAPYSDVLGNWASSYIKTLTVKVNLKSVQGSYFKPDSYATISDTVKMVFDTTGYDYSSNFIQEAYKAGLIDRNDAGSPNSYCSTEKALYMLMTMYERKSGETLSSKGSAADMFQDMGSVTWKYTDKVYFAVENGIYSGKDKYSLNPTSSITRGELAAILVKYLEFIGEL